LILKIKAQPEQFKPRQSVFLFMVLGQEKRPKPYNPAQPCPLKK